MSRKNFQQVDLDAAARLFNSGNAKNRSVQDYLGCKPRAVTNLRKRMAITSNDGITYQSYIPAKRGRKAVGVIEIQNDVQTLLELVAENPQITKTEMRAELEISSYMLEKVLKATGLRHQRAHKQPRTRNTAQLLQERQAFARGTINLPDEERIFLDETGFNLHTQAEYGWAPGYQSFL